MSCCPPSVEGENLIWRLDIRDEDGNDIIAGIVASMNLTIMDEFGNQTHSAALVPADVIVSPTSWPSYCSPPANSTTYNVEIPILDAYFGNINYQQQYLLQLSIVDTGVVPNTKVYHRNHMRKPSAVTV